MPSILTPGLLADELVGVADIVHSAVHGALGTRPYSVDVVTRTWSGTRRGEGIVSEVAVPILPAPKWPRLGGNSMRPSGQDEEGSVTVTEISQAYTEAELYHRPQDLAQNVEFYWRTTEAHGLESAERWWVPTSPPKARRGDQEGDTADWEITLRRVEDPR